ncbi:hypothetical protein CEK28_03725 [Xenophilus sp. AP218F]|nr:hypothetical protein CEK28_03725 [Xenophilus sp. AP218F]
MKGYGMRAKKFSLIMAAVLGSSIGAPLAVAGCAGLVVGAYTQIQLGGAVSYICISNANYDAANNSGFVNGGCPPNSFPVEVSRRVSSSGGSSANCCFAKGTPILIEEGQYVPIENLCVGDKVISLNLSSGLMEDSQVIAVIKKQRILYKIVFRKSADPLYVTDDHPLWMGGDLWGAIDPDASSNSYSEYGLSFHKLVEGGVVINGHGEEVEIEKISKVYPCLEAEVYTLTVDHNDHNYLVGSKNIVAHNACCFAAGSLILMSDNSQIQIEDLNVGDSVSVMNFARGQIESAYISETVKGEGLLYSVEFDDGTVERLTDCHPVWNGFKWLSINPEKSHKIYQHYDLRHGELEIGSTLLNASGKQVTVSSITPWRVDSVYSICVEHEDHNFIVGNGKIIAHNKRGGK